MIAAAYCLGVKIGGNGLLKLLFQRLPPAAALLSDAISLNGEQGEGGVKQCPRPNMKKKGEGNKK